MGGVARGLRLPTLGDMPVDGIASADAMRALTPIWSAKRETAIRVRRRISAVMWLGRPAPYVPVVPRQAKGDGMDPITGAMAGLAVAR